MCNKFFFVDDRGNGRWKFVLQRKPRSCRVLSKADAGLEIKTLHTGRDAEHHGLRDISTPFDIRLGTPILRGCKVLTTEDVSKTLEAVEEDPYLEMMLSNARKGGRMAKTITICTCHSLCIVYRLYISIFKAKK